MLTCISCSKQVSEGDEDEVVPRTKEAVKSFATQIKEMAQKLKPCAGSTDTSYKKGSRPFPEFDAISEDIPYTYTRPPSSSSTTAWDFSASAHQREAGSQIPLNSRQVTGGRPSVTNEDMLVNGEDGSKEWMAQVEPGVHITFASLPNGGNDLRRIRFSREMFDKWQAQRWWGENYDRILELYNVQRFNRQALQTPLRSEDGRDSSYSRLGSVRESPMMTPREYYKPYGYQHQAGSSTYGAKGEAASIDASRTTTSSRDEASMSVCSEVDSEWVEQDEPGVYITIRQLVDGTRELRRVRFSRERFAEVNAKQWWEENKDRIQSQYL
ncbi:unnamed protein product [Rhodiola kirilowii]